MAENDSSASTMIVALVAILVIIALGFILYRSLPGMTNNGTDINVTIPEGTTAGGAAE